MALLGLVQTEAYFPAGAENLSNLADACELGRCCVTIFECYDILNARD